MSIWRQGARGLRALLRRRAVDQEIADEVQDYFDRSAAEYERQGLSPKAARRAAAVESGPMTYAREEVRTSGWEDVVETLLMDLRYSLRRLARSPGFTLVAVVTLALGIGAATAIFSAINPILLEPLPYPRADRLLAISDQDNQGVPKATTFGNFEEIAARARSFDQVALSDAWQPALTAPNANPERLQGQRVTTDYFRTIGVEPFAGRDFAAAEDRPNGERVAILSYGLLQRRFGGDRAVIGTQVMLDGNEYTVIGVMPAGFENVPLPSADVWSTEQYQPNAAFLTREWGHHSSMIARLRPGVNLDQAQADLQQIAHLQRPEWPRPAWANLINGLGVHRLQDDVTRTMKPALLALAGAVSLLLLIAAVNIANLVLARAAQRRGEFAMRAALGAGGRRLVRQLLTESVVLSLVGGLAGLLIAAIGVRAFVALAPDSLPRVHAIRLDAAALAFGIALTTLVGLAVGLLPALDASRREPQASMQSVGTRTVGGRQATRRVLVVAEMSLALVLLTGAGLLTRSMRGLLAVAPGFDPTSMMALQVEEVGAGFRRAQCVMTCLDSARTRYFANVVDAVRAVPGVVSAAATSQLPLSGDLDGYGVQTEAIAAGDMGSALRYLVTPSYFSTMRIPLLRGRLLTDADERGGDEAIVVSESFARHYFGSSNPIGQHVKFGPETMNVGGTAHPWDVVVGVVGDVKQASLATTDADAFYVPSYRWRWTDNVQSIVVRTRGDAAALAPSLVRAIWSVDRNEPITRVTTMDALVAKSAAQQRFALAIFGAFALIALVLAAVGIYGVLSGGVSERVREIGVRAALGASPTDVLALILRQGLALAIAGVLIGLAGAAAATGALRTLLFGITPLDPLTFGAVVVLLLVTAAAACAIPAWRASRLDVTEALRVE